ncbi:unnamed protein product, partial [Closterium sp. Naga37s-1]
MFMRNNAGYDIKNTPSCKGILPESAYVNAPIWGSDAGVSELKLLSKVQRQVENHERIPQDQQDFLLKERWLIWMPRFGLGNSLRAYTSAFIFALLSGRRLLRWHGGNHKQVLDRLCNAFYCGIDELRYKGDIGRHAKLMDAKKLEIHGFDYSPNVVAVYSGKFFDRLWRGDPQINQCVHDAFSCRSLWLWRGDPQINQCVHDAFSCRSLWLWRGDPQINQCVHDAFSCRTIWCIRSKVVAWRPPDKPVCARRLLLPHHLVHPLQSALSLHSLLFPLPHPFPPGAFFDRLWRGDPQINQCVHDAFSCRTIWCIRSKVLSLLLGNGPKPGMQDVVDRDLRVVPPLVLRGEEVGRKEGEVTGGKVEPQMVPKGEGLRLQFDVALHIRGHAINVEGDYCVKKDKICQEKAQKGEQIREHAYMKPRQWRCIARLMQFLRIKKAAAGGFTNATAAADGSANSTGRTVGIFNGKASNAAANAATKSGK